MITLTLHSAQVSFYRARGHIYLKRCFIITDTVMIFGVELLPKLTQGWIYGEP